MLGRIVSFLTICASGILLSSCFGSPPVTQLEDHYMSSFLLLKTPKVSEIKAKGKNLPILQAPMDEVWQSMVMVLMQTAPIVRVSKQNGLLVAPPFVLYAENQGGVKLYAYFMDEVYRGLIQSDEYAIKVDPQDTERYLDTILGQIVTQLQVENKLKPGGRWSYLSLSQQ
jgi:hypothetical protein